MQVRRRRGDRENLLTFDVVIGSTFMKAPLAPRGYTAENRYTLQPPFTHRECAGRSSA